MNGRIGIIGTLALLTLACAAGSATAASGDFDENGFVDLADYRFFGDCFVYGGPRDEMPPSCLEDGLGNVRGNGMGTAMGSAGAIVQTRRSLLLHTADPLVSGLAANAVPSTELGHTKEAVQVIGDESGSFVHR